MKKPSPPKTAPQLDEDDPKVKQMRRELEHRQEAAFLASIPTPSAETMRRVGKAAGFERECDRESIDAIARLQAEWETATKGINDHTYTAARAAWQEYHDRELAKPDLRQAETFTLQEFQRDFSVKLREYKARARDASEKAFEIVKPMIHDFHVYANSLADQLEFAEQSKCEELAIPYRSSTFVLTIRKCGWLAQQRARSFSPGISPREIADFLPIS